MSKHDFTWFWSVTRCNWHFGCSGRTSGLPLLISSQTTLVKIFRSWHWKPINLLERFGFRISSSQMRSKGMCMSFSCRIHTCAYFPMEKSCIAWGNKINTSLQPIHFVSLKFFNIFRLSLTLSCPMDLKSFPFDTQTCHMRMASCKLIISKVIKEHFCLFDEFDNLIFGWTDGYTTKDLIFKWKTGDPVQVTPHLALAKFTLTHFKTDHCDSHTNTGGIP